MEEAEEEIKESAEAEEEIIEEEEEVVEEVEVAEEEVKEAEAEEKEVKKPGREEIEEEIVEERTYTIPLRRAWVSPRNKRAPKAIRLVKSFVQRHMKPEALVVRNEVNERIWSRGIENPPRRIRVRAVKDREGTVTLYLAEGD